MLFSEYQVKKKVSAFNIALFNFRLALKLCIETESLKYLPDKNIGER